MHADHDDLSTTARLAVMTLEDQRIANVKHSMPAHVLQADEARDAGVMNRLASMPAAGHALAAYAHRRYMASFGMSRDEREAVYEVNGND